MERNIIQKQAHLKGNAKVSGSKFNHMTPEKYADTAWEITKAALWEQFDFSTEEIKRSKQFICAFLKNQKELYNGYLIFIQRVLLAHQYINKQTGKYIPLPGRWFSKDNLQGFAGTERWMQKLNEVRRSLPGFSIELKAFAEAIIEMCEVDAAPDFRYWKQYFTERSHRELYRLFALVLINIRYSK